jgi:hypothetical protein
MRGWFRGKTRAGDVDASHQTVRLDAGRHGGPGSSVCVMELASILAGERFSDHPRSVCPTVSALLRAYNDSLDDEQRQRLYRYASESVGTREGYVLQETRARFALAWAKSRMYGRKRRWAFLIKREGLSSDASPGDVAEFVVRSLGRHPTAETHEAMRGLLDWMITMQPSDAEGSPAHTGSPTPTEAPTEAPAPAHTFPL